MRSPVKLLFLDVDGVLNDYETIVAASNQGRDLSLEEHLMDMINPTYVERVNRILQVTGARVVLSSSWRRMFDTMPEIRDFFAKVGFDTRLWLGRTPVRYHGLRLSDMPSRGLEIQRFLSSIIPVRDVTSIVILDDDQDMAHLNHRLVRTAGRAEGISEKNVEEAINLFNTKDDAHVTFVWKK